MARSSHRLGRGAPRGPSLPHPIRGGQAGIALLTQAMGPPRDVRDPGQLHHPGDHSHQGNRDRIRAEVQDLLPTPTRRRRTRHTPPTSRPPPRSSPPSKPPGSPAWSSTSPGAPCSSDHPQQRSPIMAVNRSRCGAHADHAPRCERRPCGPRSACRSRRRAATRLLHRAELRRPRGPPGDRCSLARRCREARCYGLRSCW